MDYHGIDMKGPFVMEIGDTSVFNASDERRIKYNPSNEKMYFASSTGWIQLSEKYSDIPQNTIMLFCSNFAIAGFTILTTVDDEVVYITKGSGAGGEVGGTLKLGSTWTQPQHQHNLTPHSHTIPSHAHTFSDETDETDSTSYNDGGSGDAAWIDHSHTFSGTTSLNADTTGNNAAALSGLTTPPDWRPKGVNFTRQMRA